MSKATSFDKEVKIASLNNKKKLIEKFIELKDMAESDPREMVRQYLELLEEPEIEQAVRRGDIFAIVIEYHFEMQEYDKCLQYLKLMK